MAGSGPAVTRKLTHYVSVNAKRWKMDSRKTPVRAVLAVFLLLSIGLVGFGVVKWSVVNGGADVVEADAEPVAPADGTTVITTSMSNNNQIVAYAPNGSVLHHNDTYLVYDDVDPSPKGEYTVTYAATRRLSKDECDSSKPCSRNVIERLNLSTGESERIYSRVTSSTQGHWHDVDRVGPHRWLVADIAHDRAFIVNTTTGVETWSWHAQASYPTTSGGRFPKDWVHLNDVEELPDGRIMLSLRNQDTVAFVSPTRGYQENWTLGTDGNHSTLYEQHNPDYIPAGRGGPAVLIADSENNRIVEYQRRNGTWDQTWRWSDPQLRWPRDADRLPNSNTLITDTNGNRVIEVNQQGDVVWKVDIKGPYEAERLATSDESAGGPSATQAGLETRKAGNTVDARKYPLWEQIADDVVAAWSNAIPNTVLNPLLYVLPPWIGVVELGGVMLFLVTGSVWIGIEFHWSSYQLNRPVVKGGSK